MAAVVCRYNTAHISQLRRFRASLEATGHHHWASIMSDIINRTWLRQFFYVFIVKNVGKGHGLMLRPLFLIRVWHIEQKRRAWLRWVYNLLGGTHRQNMICMSGYCIVFLFVRTVSKPCVWTLIKTPNFVIFYKFLIHLGVHHTICLSVSLSFCLSVCLSLCLSLCLSVCLSVRAKRGI
jgi:hypothetical protein